MFGKCDFTKCPHFEAASECPSKLEAVNAAMFSRRESDTKLADALSEHVRQDTIAHKETNETLKTLIDDKASRDKLRDRRDRIKEKIYGTIAVAVLIGAYNFFINLYDISKALGVQP